MTATIDIAVKAPGWNGLPEAETAVRRAVEAALADAGRCEIGVLLTGDAEMRALNRRWRGKDSPTNVLSFPSPDAGADGVRFLGDVALALETIRREAEAEQKPFEHHLAHLAVHGTLHLLGFDHEGDADADAMEARERAILAGLGIPDPHAAQQRTAEPA